MKKIFWMLAFVLIICIISTSAIADYLDLPSSIKQIAEEAFANDNSIDNVYLPFGTESIGARAFAESSVHYIYLPESISYIASDAFDGCDNIQGYGYDGTYACEYFEKHNLPYERHYYKDDFLFTSMDGDNWKIDQYLGNATEVDLPSCVLENGKIATTIGSVLFVPDNNVVSITIPEGYTTIERSAFIYCTNLKTIYMPSSIQEIARQSIFGSNMFQISVICEPGSFVDTWALSNGLKSQHNTAKFSYNNINDTLCEIAKYNGTNQKLIIDSINNEGKTVAGIASGAFNMASVQTVYIPNTVISIADDAFADPRSIEVICEADSYAAEWANKNQIQYHLTSSNFSYTALDEMTCSVSGYSGTASIVNLPQTDKEGREVTAISPHTFYGNKMIKEVHIPATVNKIDNYAFWGCENMESISIPDQVSFIGSYAFADCSSLATIELPQSLSSLADYVFRNCNKLRKITIPQNVNEIGNYAFYECSSLSHVEMPTAISRIGQGAFNNCNSLLSLYLPDSITISDGAFNSCNAKIYANIGTDTAKSLSKSSQWDRKSIFYDPNYPNVQLMYIFDGENAIDLEVVGLENKSVNSVVLPSGVTIIGTSAFWNCSNLSYLSIPSSVCIIKEFAIYNSPNLKTVYLPNNIETIEKYNFNDQTIYATLHSKTSNAVTKTTLHFYDEMYPDYAFYGAWDDGTLCIECKNTDIESAVIPYGIEAIGWEAFRDCTKLNTIDMPETIKIIKEGAFANCTGLRTVTIPDGCTTVIGAFYGCKYLREINFPESVTYVGGSFSGCENLVKILAPVHGDNFGFENCYALKKVVLAEDVTSIGNFAFYNCTNLEYITIPETVTSIGYDAFYGCASLESINIPQAITYIGDSAFSWCGKLKTVNIPDNIEYIGKDAFDNIQFYVTKGSNAAFALSKGGNTFIDKNNPEFEYRYLYENEEITGLWCAYSGDRSTLKRITIPSDVTVLSGFANCENLISITLPQSVKEISANTFAGCTQLANIKIPSSVEKIGQTAFAGCSSLTSINIPKGVTTIEYNTFANCAKLSSVDIPSTVTEIGSSAFAGCSSLVSIKLPTGITIIKDNTFADCKSLSSINIPNGVIMIESYAFKNCINLENIFIPKSVTSIAVSAFYGKDRLNLKVESDVQLNLFNGTGAFVYTDHESNDPLTIKLKAALTYTRCSQYTVIPIAGHSLSEQEEGAMVMSYLERIIDMKERNIPITSISTLIISNVSVSTCYFDEQGNNRKMEYTILYSQTAEGTASAQLASITGNLTATLGTALISYNGQQYLINPADPETILKSLNTMRAILTIDAAKALKNGLTEQIDMNNPFGKNGAITYLKNIFNELGINTDSITVIEQLKKSLEAESISTYLESIKTLINIMIQTFV